MSDDGVDRLYDIYFEDNSQPCVVQCTAKSASPAGTLQNGDTVTLILGALNIEISRPVAWVFFPLALNSR
jgi:hypothetical protein